MKFSSDYSEKAESKKTQGFKQPWRPKSVDKHEAGVSCPHCGASVNIGDAICGSCGRSLIEGKCSFCGALMKPTSKFCTCCGQSREGVKCPECGTINSRNFCRRCNTPLTPAALKFREEALNDPEFKVIEARAAELAALHRKIEEMEASSDATLSETDKNLLDEYADLLSSIGSVSTVPKSSPAVETSSTTEPPYSFNMVSIEDLMKAYREKAEEMNQALAEMAPPPEYTPEQQRDYYAARKVATLEYQYDMEGYTPTMWKCNYCGCLHSTPPECTYPELGGVWIYVSPEEYISQNPVRVTSATLKIN